MNPTQTAPAADDRSQKLIEALSRVVAQAQVLRLAREQEWARLQPELERCCWASLTDALDAFERDLPALSPDLAERHAAILRALRRDLAAGELDV